MKNRKLIAIGTITKTHGFEGAVAVKITGRPAGEPKINEPVFVVIDGIPVPFFIRDVYFAGGDTMILAFDDYATPASVMMLKGCEVRCEAPKGSGESPDELAGYTIVDTNTSFRAPILSVGEQSGQILATVDLNGREIFIPLHPDLIISVDDKRKVIKMSLPEGLTDLNM
mgnify:FL=1